MKIEGTTRGEIFWMDCDDPRLVIVTDKQHRLYDPRVELPVNNAMVTSIIDPKIGIIEPVIVRRVSDSYEVVDGRQRVKAAREAQAFVSDRKIRVPLIVRSSINDAAAAGMAAITNNQRIEETPVQKGIRARTLSETGHSKEEICSIFGVGWNTVSGWIAISESPEVAEKISSGEITATEAAKEAKRKTSTRKIPAIERPTENIKIVGKRFKDGWRIKMTNDAIPGDMDGFLIALRSVLGGRIEVISD